MHAPERVRPPDAAPARRGTLEPRAQSRRAASRTSRGVLEHQLLRVRGAQHRLHRLGQLVIEELAHAEEVGRRVLAVRHHERMGVLPRGTGVEEECLRQRGEAELPRLENDEPHRPSRVLLAPGRRIELALRRVQAKRHDRAALRADLQARLDVVDGNARIHRPPSSPRFASHSSKLTLPAPGVSSSSERMCSESSWSARSAPVGSNSHVPSGSRCFVSGLRE